MATLGVRITYPPTPEATALMEAVIPSVEAFVSDCNALGIEAELGIVLSVSMTVYDPAARGGEEPAVYDATPRLEAVI